MDLVNSMTRKRVSVILPAYNELENIKDVLRKLLEYECIYALEIIVVDDDSIDGTANYVRELARANDTVRPINRLGRNGLASAIKEGLLNATGDYAVDMDSDGQHEAKSVKDAINVLCEEKVDLVIGSRFHIDAEIDGLSERREVASNLANTFARLSLSKNYSHLSDYMTGFFAIRLSDSLAYIRRVEVNGFKFLYELLAVSHGRMSAMEIPLRFQGRVHGTSNLDIAILWDYFVSVVHNLSFRIIPRRAISFAAVGISGVAIQFSLTSLLLSLASITFQQALPASVITATTSNYIINNALTFRSNRLRGKMLGTGLSKYMLVVSLPIIANISVSTTFYNLITSNTYIAQLTGIAVAFAWNYLASSKFVWNSP